MREAAAWFCSGRGARRRWVGTNAKIVAWAGLAAAAICPPAGMGFSVCLFRACTGVPCPGCGLTRSLSCCLRGHLQEGLAYHPLGPCILLLFLGTALLSILPASRRRLVEQRLESHPVLLNSLYFTFVVTFVSFGLGRALLLSRLCQ